MALKLAIIGFRHGHILDLYQRATAMADIEIVATCEEDAETRRQIAAEHGISITHENVDDLLDNVACDAVAVGDTYGQRGAVAIHALDALPWITGIPLKRVVAARCWNAFAHAHPHFKDAGQLLLEMANGCGVVGDVSYFMPDSAGYTSPFYWRTTFWGRDGVLETSIGADQITVSLNGEQDIRYESIPQGTPGGYLRSFVRDIEGTLHEDELSTQNVLRAARSALIVQHVADQGLYGIDL